MHVTTVLHNSAEDSIALSINMLTRIKFWRQDKKLCTKKINRRIMNLIRLKNELRNLIGEGYDN
jgi:hypothetical protein